MKCEICKKEYKNKIALSKHISKIHNIKSKEYYNRYLKKENEGICYCGKETKFISCGYRKYCSNTCAQNSKEVIDKKNRKLIGLKQSKETILRRSIKLKGLKRTEEQRLAISSRLKGKKFTQQAIENMSKSHIGKKHSVDHKIKIGLGNKGKFVSEDTRKILSAQKIGNNWNKGRKLSEEIRYKQSISTIKYLKENNYSPRRGKHENQILDDLEKSIGIKILRNDLDIALISGKPADGYIKDYNLSIEVLEKHHFTSSGELSKYDINREAIIANKLACMIYYIPEQEFLKNPEKEIERFKNFIHELTEQNQKAV